MKKIVMASVLILAGLGGWLLIKEKEGDIRHLELIGDSQFLVDLSRDNGNFLYTGMSFSKDSLSAKVYERNMVVCKGFVSCSFLTDSTFLAFNKELIPYLLNSKSGQIVKVNIDFDFKSCELSKDLRVVSTNSRRLLLCRTETGIISFDLDSIHVHEKILRGEIVKDIHEIEGYDFIDNKLILCVSDGCVDGDCAFRYVLFDLVSKKQTDVFKLSKSKFSSYSPVVAFLDKKRIFTNYYDRFSRAIIVDIATGEIVKKYELFDLKVINAYASRNAVYLTVFDELIRDQNSKKNNVFENLYRGMNIVVLAVN